MRKISILSALALCALVFACKKDKDEEPKKKPAELIVGSWNFVVSKEYVTRVTGTPEDTTYRTFGAQDSLIFEPNGSVISRIKSTNYTDTSTYHFVTDSTFVMWKDTVKVSLITENKMQIYTKDTIYGNAGGIREYWDEFKR